MLDKDFKSKEFLPEYLQEQELYKHITEVIDYAIENYHTVPMQDVRALYDITNEDFSQTQTLKHLGYENFFSFASPENDRAVAAMLSNIYDLKGTKKGLIYLLRLMKLDAEVYEWYDINKWHEEGDPNFPNEVEPCSIILNIASYNDMGFGICEADSRWAIPRQGQDFYEGIDPSIAFEDTDAKFRFLATKLLWICVHLNEIRWTKRFEDTIDITDDITVEGSRCTKTIYDRIELNYPTAAVIRAPSDVVPLRYIGMENLYIGMEGFELGSDEDYIMCLRRDPKVYYIGYHETATRPFVIGNGLRIGEIYQYMPEVGQYSKFLIGSEEYMTYVSEGCPYIQEVRLDWIEADISRDPIEDSLDPRDEISPIIDFTHSDSIPRPQDTIAYRTVEGTNYIGDGSNIGDIYLTE